MKIESSVLDLRASHQAESSASVRERLRTWGGERPESGGGGSRAVATDAAPTVSISAAGRAAAHAGLGQADAAQAAAAERTGDAVDAVDADPVLSLLRQLIEYLTGKPVRVFDGAALSSARPAAELPAAAQQSAAPATPSRAGFGVEYDRTEVREEHEVTAFAASGVVRTQDGREIRFQVELAMTRDYREESTVSLRLGDAVRKDPLVLNFAGTAAQLADARVAFDLDSDGTAEALPTLSGGSAYLVFDRNGNGLADGGGELFGPATGNGFAELATLDRDGNGWIDEADAAWSSLGLWSPTSGGTLKSLAAAGVGAIATGSVASPFALRGNENSQLGEVRASGVWLGEEGEAGSVQQVDLFA